MRLILMHRIAHRSQQFTLPKPAILHFQLSAFTISLLNSNFQLPQRAKTGCRGPARYACEYSFLITILPSNKLAAKPMATKRMMFPRVYPIISTQ